MSDLCKCRVSPSACLLHCCDTYRAIGEKLGIDNVPKETETREAIAAFLEELVAPIERAFGRVEFTYGFAGRELVREIKKKKLPNITPDADGHAGFELNTRKTRICKQPRFAADLRVAGVDADRVVKWAREQKLPFDRILYYSPKRPLHLGWATKGNRAAVCFSMLEKTAGGVYPVGF